MLNNNLEETKLVNTLISIKAPLSIATSSFEKLRGAIIARIMDYDGQVSALFQKAEMKPEVRRIDFLPVYGRETLSKAILLIGNNFFSITSCRVRTCSQCFKQTSSRPFLLSFADCKTNTVPHSPCFDGQA